MNVASSHDKRAITIREGGTPSTAEKAVMDKQKEELANKFEKRFLPMSSNVIEKFQSCIQL